MIAQHEENTKETRNFTGLSEKICLNSDESVSIGWGENFDTYRKSTTFQLFVG